MDDVCDELPEPTEPLSNVEVDNALSRLRGWRREDGGIRNRFRHANFRDAIAFVSNIADLAEAANHHPDIDIRFRTVIIFLTTHEAGGVTRLDIDLARRIDELA